MKKAKYNYLAAKEKWLGVLFEERDGKKIVLHVKTEQSEEEIEEWCYLMTHPIELAAAWTWDCPHCGHKNWETSVVCEMDWEEKRRKKLDCGIPLDEDGEFITWPDFVECRQCEYSSDTTYGDIIDL